MTDSPPLVYISDDSLEVRTLLSEHLRASGIEIYLAASANNPENPTSFVGGFKCAVLDLDNVDGKDDPIDTADLLRVYQPTLPVAFLHEVASQQLVKRAEQVGTVFEKPGELAKVLEWVLECAKG
jgi:CheY-like chemotaxis protein